MNAYLPMLEAGDGEPKAQAGAFPERVGRPEMFGESLPPVRGGGAGPGQHSGWTTGDLGGKEG